MVVKEEVDVVDQQIIRVFLLLFRLSSQGCKPQWGMKALAA